MFVYSWGACMVCGDGGCYVHTMNEVVLLAIRFMGRWFQPIQLPPPTTPFHTQCFSSQ